MTTIDELDRVWCDTYNAVLHEHWQPDRGDDYKAALDTARHAAMTATLDALAAKAEEYEQWVFCDLGTAVSDWIREQKGQ